MWCYRDTLQCSAVQCSAVQWWLTRHTAVQQAVPRWWSDSPAIRRVKRNINVLYCTLLYCTILYCTVQYSATYACILLYNTVLYMSVFSQLYCFSIVKGQLLAPAEGCRGLDFVFIWPIPTTQPLQLIHNPWPDLSMPMCVFSSTCPLPPLMGLKVICSTVQCSAAQCITVQGNVVYSSTVQCSSQYILSSLPHSTETIHIALLSTALNCTQCTVLYCAQCIVL